MGELKTTRFWVGASTLGALGTAARGIRSLDIADDGSATLGEPVDVGPNPMFLAVSPATGVLGIVHELADGLVSTWTFEGDRLSPFSLPGATGAADPCHLAFDEAGGLIFAANYSGARVSVHHAAPDAPADAALTADFTGAGPNHERQESSHPHQAVVDSLMPPRSAAPPLSPALARRRTRYRAALVMPPNSHPGGDPAIPRRSAIPRMIEPRSDFRIVDLLMSAPRRCRRTRCRAPGRL